MTIQTKTDIPPETLAAFGGDELRARVFWEKYALRGPDGEILEATPEQMWERVAREIASAEPDQERWYQEFRWLLDGFRFLPGGRILHGAGNPSRVTLINCFFERIQEDSLEAIYTALQHVARTQSRGGGVGVDITPLRPRGSPVHNAARTSTGSVSFMELFSLTTGTIGQSGRRGALLISIEDRHPDVLEFCRIKRDLSSVRHANISVRLSDAFMRAVERDEPWTLWFEGPQAGRIERVIRARELWDELISGARDWAEPGALFWDTVKRMGTSEYGGMQVEGCNPCLTGDTLVSTSRGLIRIRDLAEMPAAELPAATLADLDGSTPSEGIIVRAWRTGRKPVYRVSTREGYSVRATADHRFYTKNRGWVAAADLRPGDQLVVQNRKGGFGTRGSLELGRVLGWLVGDGYVNSHNQQAVLTFYGEKQRVASLLQEAVAVSIRGMSRRRAPGLVAIPTYNRTHIGSRRLRDVLAAEGFDPAHKHRIPDLVWQGSEDMVRGFLQGLFSADGTILDASKSRRSVRLTGTSETLLSGVQLLLANFAIASRIYRNRRPMGFRPMPDGRGGVKTCSNQAVHELVISRDNILRFAQEIGFLPGSAKATRLQRLVESCGRGPYAERFIARVSAVREDGVEEVYDLSEPISNTFIANALAVHNCAEEPLEHGGCCDLGSINLARFVLDPFTPQARVDREALRRAVRAAVRFLDNVHEYSLQRHLYPLPHQEEAARRSRRVGVGITGLGDMLIQLGLRYDSEKAIAFAGDLMRDIKETAYRAGVDLAREKGPFPAFDADQHLAQPFFSTFPDELVEAIRRYGLRNVSLLTIPPVGSGSALAGCSSGMEPVFALSYIRRSESLSREFFHVLHPLVAEYAEAHGLDLSGLQTAAEPHEYLRAKLPPEFVVAHEIDPLRRVDMQAALQAHIDQSISSTVNLPRDATAQTVERVYFHAWRSGLKGITVYVEGSREGVLLTPEEAKSRSTVLTLSERVRSAALQVIPDLRVDGKSPEEEIEKTVHALVEHARAGMTQLQLIGNVPTLRPRPEVLYGVTLPQKAPEGSLQVTVNEVDGEPFELIVHGGKTGSDILAIVQALARAASMLLRLQKLIPQRERLQLLIDQWRGIKGSRQLGIGPDATYSAPDAIARALERYLAIKRGQTEPEPEEVRTEVPVTNGNMCPRCQQFALVSEEGCTKCVECGFREC